MATDRTGTTTRSLRLTLILALVGAVLVGAVRPAEATRPGGTADFQLQVFGCPDSYASTDYLIDCVPGGIRDSRLVDLIGTDDEIYSEAADAEGIARFDAIPAGTYQFSVGVFRPFNAVYYACFDITSGTESFLFDGTATVLSGGRTIELTGGGSFSCRYYVIPGNGYIEAPPLVDPADASVGVQVRTCPADYDGQAFLTDCGPARTPVGVTLNDGLIYDRETVIADETGDEGRAGFVELMAGDYFLEVDQDTISGPATFYAACFDVTTGAEDYRFDSDRNGFGFPLTASADLFCRVYVVPYGTGDASGSVSLSVGGCPMDYDGSAYATDCPTGPNDFTGYLLPAGSDFRDAIDQGHFSDGVATFEAIPDGEYAVMMDIPGHAITFAGACRAGREIPADDLIAGSSGRLPLTVVNGATVTCVLYLSPDDLRG